MGYKGISAPIPLGQMGLFTDEPDSLIPPSAAVSAQNIALFANRVEKSRGSSKYSATALESPIVALVDYWPTATDQRLFAATANGKLWRDGGDGAWTAATAVKTGLGALTPDCHFVVGGAEEPGNGRKLFFFTDTHQVQMVTADGTTSSNITTPAADWTGSNFPSYGGIYSDRLFALMGHNLYISKLGDHKDFNTSVGTTAADPQVYHIFPGEGDKLVSAFVWRGILVLFKKPFGVYLFDWRDTSVFPTISRLNDTFGIASPHAFCQVLNDMIGGANFGTLISLNATEKFGNIEEADILKNTRTRNHIRENFSASGHSKMHSIFYPEKQVAMFTGRGNSSTTQDRIIMMDVNRESPRIHIETKDQPNCLALRKDSNGILRPIYGNQAGFVLQMDQETRNVADTAYAAEFKTPPIDFSFMDAALMEKSKMFDFLTISYVATGSWSFYVDVYIDGVYSETIEYAQAQGAVLDDFTLDVDVLGGYRSQVNRRPLHGTGKTIAFRIYNNNLNEFFRVDRMVVGFRPSGEQNEDED